MAAPFIELLGHMEMVQLKESVDIEKEKNQRWLSFLSLYHANPMADKEGREKFMEIIRPKDISSKDIPKFETDFELLKRLKAMQEGG